MTTEKTTSREASDEPVPKKLFREVNPTNCLQSDVDEELCCMCFGSYSVDVIECSGRDWTNCACGQWLHEDCTEDHWVD